ncbi:MAG: hypothetical protein PHS96_10185 [Anaerolineales bacterium]|nr:hypothetical protein [Anaerolineales bacterium]MDD5468165.1 hypothetical protein [Anaerolineales bacterium]
MPRIRCHYVDCVLLDDGYCGAAAIELDPDMGCMTYKRADDLAIGDEWEEEESEELEEWEDMEIEDEDDELWIDEDEY